MLISLHLPKTAGSSFSASIARYYQDSLMYDYGDLPINTPVFKRNVTALKNCIPNAIKTYKNIECIHGHFLPLKYLFCRNTKFVTWMRDPKD